MPFPVVFVASVVVLGKSSRTVFGPVGAGNPPTPRKFRTARPGAMQNSRAVDGIRGLVPLAFCLIYFLNPRRSHEIAYSIIFLALALLSLWKNPFRGQPRSPLLLSVVYALATIAMSATFLIRHHGIDALWTGVFLGIGVGWWFWYRHDYKLSNRSPSTRDTSLEINHG